jgi:RNA polymerase sigma-70 factor (ECF subfamily)
MRTELEASGGRAADAADMRGEYPEDAPTNFGRGLDVDTQLLIAGRECAESFARFYRRTRDDLLRWLYRRTCCPEVAADLCAETYATALMNLSHYDAARGTARAWLFTIAGTQLQRYWRKGQCDRRARERLGIPPLAVDDEAIAHVESLADLAKCRPELNRCLNALSPQDRSLVKLRLVEGKPYEEVALALGCSPGAARVRVTRVVARLRSHLALDLA